MFFTGNWQYAAGVGSDPREDRYFNLVKQAKGYDPKGEYMRLWCPELGSIRSDALISPHDPERGINPKLRQQKGLTEELYPSPIVPLMFATDAPRPSSGGKGKSDNYKKRSQQHGKVPGW